MAACRTQVHVARYKGLEVSGLGMGAIPGFPNALPGGLKGCGWRVMGQGSVRGVRPMCSPPTHLPWPPKPAGVDRLVLMLTADGGVDRLMRMLTGWRLARAADGCWVRRHQGRAAEQCHQGRHAAVILPR